jgi:cytochrome c oxidase subunit IV
LKENGKTAEAGFRSYLAVWAALLFLTAVTVTAASLNIGRLAIIVVLAIAAVKSSLVFLYFMHLRYEKRILVRILIPIALALLAIFIGLTYTDVMNR